MARYFIEVSYKGGAYAGFQVQQNANTIQAEIEKALNTYFKQVFELTGSSRTDSGVHAVQNYFHFDHEEESVVDWEKIIYNLNAILPDDVVIQKIFRVQYDAHCRFNALSRTYEYTIYRHKDPFIADRAFYYPYSLNIVLLNEAAKLIEGINDFETFSKRNTQVQTFNCEIFETAWQLKGGLLVYRVRANRFLRGMVKGLVGTMLKVGREKITLNDFFRIIQSHDAALADFSVPSHGLMLMNVQFPENIIPVKV